jgi:hypothetical protein
MFEVEALTDIYVYSMAFSLIEQGTSGSIKTITASIYVKSGNYVGSEENKGDWTLIMNGGGGLLR